MLLTKEIRTNKKEEFIDITSIIQNEIAKSKIDEGKLLVFIPHTTAGVTINENADPSVVRDILKGLNSFKLESLDFQHMEGNSPAHIKSSLFGVSLTLIIKNSSLVLGTWQGIYFCEFDGPRTRKFILQF